MTIASDKKIRVRDRVPKRYEGQSALTAFFQSLLRPVSIPLTSGFIRPNRKNLRRHGRVHCSEPAGTKMTRQCQKTSARGFDGTMR